MTFEKSKGDIGNDVLAVMRSGADVDEAVSELASQGFEREGIRVFRPGEVAEEVDPTGKHSGLLQRILRTYQGMHADENGLLEEYEEAGRSGADVIAVHVGKPEEAERAGDILQAHNAENIRHFGTFAVTDMEGQGRAAS